MDRVALTGFGLAATLALGLSIAGPALAETVTVHPSPNGQYFAKLICDAVTCEGTGYRATAADSNLALWRVPSVRAGRITLSDDGELMASHAGGTLTLYIGGQQVGTLQGDVAIASIARDPDGIVLVTSSGAVRQFLPVQPEPVELLPVDALPPVPEPEQAAQQAHQQRAVETPAPAVTRPRLQEPVATPVLPAVAPRPATVEPGSQTPESPVTAPAPLDRAVAAPSPSPTAAKPPAPAAGTSYRCEVNAVMRSGRRVSIVQQGPSAAVATDRAMAYCEGMVGAGSRKPAGTCEMLACQALEG